MKSLKSLIFTIFLMSWNADAAVVTWTLDNIEVSGTFGAFIATGSFGFNADTGDYSNINITSAGTYGEFSLLNGDDSFLDLTGLTSGGITSILNLNYGSALTNAGGVISVSVEEVVLPTPITPVLLTGFGNITAPTVPIPAAVWLFGSGLIGLIGIARKKKS